jgi:hypothetical protein
LDNSWWILGGDSAVELGLPAGRYAVVWEDVQGGDHDLYGQVVSPRGTLQGGNYLAAWEPEDERGPRLGLDDFGNALAVWHRDNGGTACKDMYGRWLGSDGQAAGGESIVYLYGHAVQSDDAPANPVLPTHLPYGVSDAGLEKLYAVTTEASFRPGSSPCVSTCCVLWHEGVA